ncbi:Aldose 1-epimerase [Mucinivorans hirudinis]|uniref:Aldose 1-epimerase n=1 Tax=Mucinivorans hirudinis TaxID=1433126 RepID=A0A060RB80_9BACT|nr:Aldose 1-epimerase [Mucinivorans hirudinis]
MINVRKINLETPEDLLCVEITNTNGAKVELLNLGATIMSLYVPDRNGLLRNVVLSYNDISEYRANQFYFGSTIGRYANRISNGCFRLADKTYKLQINDFPNTNHGGYDGLHSKFFKIRLLDESVEMSYLSADGEAGFPGEVFVVVIYKLTEDNELIIEYRATSDQDTPLNLTNHCYFNLSGDPALLATDALLCIDAEKYMENDSHFIPTGRVLNVDSTKYDFREIKQISSAISQYNCKSFNGFNEYFLLRNEQSTCVLYDQRSGIKMTLRSNYPGIQFYTGDFLRNPRSGICLESQLYPDAPNRPELGDLILKPGCMYNYTIKYKFQIQ